MANKQGVLITILVLVIVILAGILAYVFLVRPTLTGYVVDRQIEGYNICLSSIVSQVQQNGFVQIPIGNQTLYLAPFNPQQTQ